MSADFTDAEIESAVQSLIRSAIRRQYGSLGQRATNLTFQDFQEQTIAVVTLTPNAPYYLVFLGTERLVAAIGDLSDTLEQTDDAVQALGRSIVPVTSITSLANAKVAADALSLAAGSRGKAFANIESAPAFQRLDRNIQQFLTDYSAPNMKRGQAIVRTPAEGRAALPGLIRDLLAQRDTLVAKVQSLAGAILDYEALNLPALLASGVVQRAAQVIAAATQTMQQLTPETRVSQIRSVTLSLLAARTVVRNFGSLSTPTNFVTVQGTGGPFADVSHPSIPAHLVAELPGAYATRADTAAVTNQLDFLLDGTFRTVASMSGSYLASLAGIAPEPYDIFDVTTPATENDRLELRFTTFGFPTTVVVPLIAGLGRTAQQICDDITLATTGMDIEAKPAIQPLKFQGNVDIAGTDPAALTFTSTNPAQNWAAIGIKDGDKIRVLSGTNTDSVYQVNVAGVGTVVLTCTRLTGPATTLETNQLIEVGGPSFTVRIKTKDSVAATAIPGRWFVSVTASDDTVKRRTATTLGFSPGALTTARPLDAQTVADSLNSASTTASADRARLKVSVATEPVKVSTVPQTSLLARSEPSQPGLLVIYRYRNRGDITVGGTAVSLALAGVGAAAQIGDVLVIRASTVGADVGVAGIVTGFTADTVQATMIQSLSVTTNVMAEVLPDYSALGYDVRAVVSAGTNAGTYTIQGGADNTLGLTLDHSLVAFQDFSAQPVFMVVDLVRQYLAFDSTDLTLASSVQIDDGSPTNPRSGAFLLFSARPAVSTGTTPWFLLPSPPDQLIEAGDTMELFVTQYNIPSSVVTVVGYDTDTRILEVDPPVPVNAGPFNFSQGSPLPFARIRKTRRDTFDLFNSQATAWLARPQLQPIWSTELDRLVTVVLSDPSPTNVTNLRLYLVSLYNLLTISGAVTNQAPTAVTIEAIAEAYTAPVVSEIDVLVESLHAQGADRAVDILLDARFRDYFGLTQDGMSYAGQVLAATKQIMQNDLPVRAVRRKELVDRQVSIGQYQDPDYEFDQSDIDNTLVPDSPLPNPASRSGDAF